MEKQITIKGDNIQVSDGSHTFDELYAHRITLFIRLCLVLHRQQPLRVWRSRYHSDGTEFPGWFIMGIDTEPGKQITYHLPVGAWHETSFALTLEKAPLFDGHTSNDVLERLKQL